MSDTTDIAADKLRAFIERIERVDEDIKSLNDDRKDILAEAKGCGFDTKAIREILRQRKMDRDERQEHKAIVELYEAALGM